MEADTDHYFPKAKELFDGEVSDRAGYVKSTLKALEMIREYETLTTTRFSTYKTSKDFEGTGEL